MSIISLYNIYKKLLVMKMIPLFGYINSVIHIGIVYSARPSLRYPIAGNGYPQPNLQIFSWTSNPAEIALRATRQYDYFSFAIENSIWRAFGFCRAHLFAWHRTLVTVHGGEAGVGCRAGFGARYGE